jgi:hypothetical protein
VDAHRETDGRGTSGTWREVVWHRCLADTWPGPWTVCPQAKWVRRVVARAGYRVVGDTGSALVAAGRGRSFYIHATGLGASGERLGRARRDEGYSLLFRIDGVAVYGDGVRETWVASGFSFWVSAGPRGDAVAPRAAELASLVRASRAIPPRR